MRRRDEFFDVSLVVSDRVEDEEEDVEDAFLHRVQAHKVILASASPFFRRVLRTLTTPSATLFLRGVSSKCLKHILEFVYRYRHNTNNTGCIKITFLFYSGEVNVEQNDLEEFLAVAQDLKIKGLTQPKESCGNGSGNNSSRASPSSRPMSSSSNKRPPMLGEPSKKRPRPATDEDEEDVQVVAPEIVKTESRRIPLPQEELEIEDEEFASYPPHQEEEFQSPTPKGKTLFIFSSLFGCLNSRESAGSLPIPLPLSLPSPSDCSMESLLAAGYLRRTDDGGFVCLLCQSVLRYASSVKRHFIERHQESNGVAFECPMCKNRYRVRRFLRNHIMRHHPELKDLDLEGSVVYTNNAS